MAYSKTTWVDRMVENPNRYTKSDESSEEVTLTPSPGTVTAEGTPISATNMNKIEQGIADVDAGLVAHKADSAKHTVMVYNVNGYGAKGNGETDDTNSIQDAIDAAIDNGASIVFFSPGTYKVTALTGTDQVKFMGDNAIFDGIDSEIEQIGKPVVDYKEKQVLHFASLLKKIADGDPIKVVAQGDSMTYGHDTVSGDKRAANSDPAMDPESTAIQTQAGKTYPEALQEFSDLMFGSEKVTVVNRGHSGDYAELSRTRWSVNPDADLHFIMIGTIDAESYSDTPIAIRKNITRYVDDMSLLVEQVLDFGSAVVLLTPPKQSLDTPLLLQAYRKALKRVGDKYDVPVIDSQEFLKAYNYNSVQSDGVHYNTKGYTAFGAKVAGVLASISSIYDPLKVHHGRPIIPAVDEYGIAFKKNGSSSTSLEGHTLAPFGVGSTANTGLMFTINRQTQLTFSFYAEDDNLVVTPIFNLANSSAELKFKLDFGIDQGSYVSPYVFGVSSRAAITATAPLKELLYTGVRNRTNIYFESSTNVMENSFHLPRRGLYTVSVENTGSNNEAYLFGFFVRKYESIVEPTAP